MLSLDHYIQGISIGLWTIGMLSVPYLILLLVWSLAQFNLLWTVVRERQAKVIMKNEAFHNCLMSYANHIFVCEIPGFPDNLPDGYKKKAPWDIVEDKWEVLRKRSGGPVIRIFHSLSLGLFQNIKWIGLPPTYKVYKYLFTWTSIEQVEDKSTGETVMRLVTNAEEKLDYIIVQQDVYGLTMKGVETDQLLPVDITAILPTQVINPVKALFNVQRWLEASMNLVSDELRLFVGRTGFSELIQRTEAGERTTRRITNSELGRIFSKLRKQFGVEMEYLGIRRVDPASEESEAFKKAAGAVFVADQRAKADEREGEGLKARAESYYGSVSNISGGVEMLQAEAIRDSKITVFAPGGHGLMPAVNVANAASSPPTPDDK